MKKAATPDGSSKWVGDEEFIEDDELVEITPDDIRLRKKILDPKLRFKENSKFE